MYTSRAIRPEGELGLVGTRLWPDRDHAVQTHYVSGFNYFLLLRLRPKYNAPKDRVSVVSRRAE